MARRHKTYLRDLSVLLAVLGGTGSGAFFTAEGVSGEGKATTVATTLAAGEEPVTRSGRCGVERWNVKTMSDAGAGSVNFTPKVASVTELGAIPAPTWKKKLPRQPDEKQTYTVKARMTAAKLEDDNDIHLAIADPGNRSATMIVEFPNDACDTNAARGVRAQMTAARNAFIAACGQPGDEYVTLRGIATITGVFFFDKIHGQRGVARNGAELHPALSFTGSCR